MGELPATAGPELLRQVAAIVNSPDFQNHAEHRGVTLYAPIRAAADAPAAEGIDLSGYQPTVDWTKVAASGIAFAFIKATEGTTLTDHTFADHWARAKRASLLRGAYHFFRPKQDAAAQARFFLAQLRDPGELPPVLDVEVVNGVPLTQIAAGVDTWLSIVTASVGRPIVYTSPSFWNALPGSFGDRFESRPLGRQLGRPRADRGPWLVEVDVLAIHEQGYDLRYPRHGGYG